MQALKLSVSLPGADHADMQIRLWAGDATRELVVAFPVRPGPMRPAAARLAPRLPSTTTRAGRLRRIPSQTFRSCAGWDRAEIPMKRFPIVMPAAAVALAIVAQAHAADAPSSTVTANVALTSDYMFRGLTQSWGRPAVQGGADLALANGFAAGVWASSISDDSYPGGSMELDLYAGYGGGRSTMRGPGAPACTPTFTRAPTWTGPDCRPAR